MFAGCSTQPEIDPAKPASDYPPLASGVAESPIELLSGTITKATEHKGKVVLLNLWGTWCGPCRGEIPHLIEMQTKYQDQGFKVLGLDIGNQDGTPESPDDIKSFVASMGMNYEVGRIGADTVRKYQQLSRFNGVPQSFLVDREGRLRGVFLGGNPSTIGQMKQIVEKVVNE